MAKALVLNQQFGVPTGMALPPVGFRQLPALASPTMFGRSEPDEPPVFPVLLLSKVSIGVKGWPDCTVKICCTCVFRVHRFPRGNSIPAAAPSRCRMSKLELPHSALRL